MPRWFLRTGGIALAVLLGVVLGAPPAHAVKEFFAEFESYYVTGAKRTRTTAALATAVGRAKCTICHPGDDKHKLSAYGGKIAMEINKFDKNNKKKIQAAFDYVANLQVEVRKDQKSPTFGMLLKQGKLPAAPWESATSR